MRIFNNVKGFTEFKESLNENHSYKEREFYDYILPGHEVGEGNKPEDAAMQMDWSEIEKSEQRIAYMDYYDTVSGIDIWYCFGSDDYYFSDAEEDASEE